MTSPVSSQAALQAYQYADYQKNVYSLWWDSKEVRLRQVQEYRLAMAHDPRNRTLGLAMGVLLTSLAVPESEKRAPYAIQALALIQEYLDQHPRNPLALAYFCTAKSLVLRNSGNLFDMMFQMGPILEAMDRAVHESRGSDEEWLVRLVRANLFVKLPDLLNKKGVAYQDFQFIAHSRESRPQIEVALPTVYYYLGKIERSRGRFQQAKDDLTLSRQKAEELGQTTTEEYRDLVRE